jgi:N4-gp56 family major capsid protein
MATTQFGTNSALAVKLFSEKTFREALKQTFMYRFMGESSNSIIQVMDDMSKSKGDQLTIHLRAQLQGAGVIGDDTLEGNEESLTLYTDSFVINQLRHAVRSDGKMTEQRIPFSIREEARIGLTDWWADRIDESFFNQLAGNTNQTDIKFTGLNATTAPTTNQIVYPDGDVSEADIASSSASSVFTLQVLDDAVERAKTQTNSIRPVRIGPDEYYVAFLHPFQVNDLRTSTANAGSWFDIQKAAIQGGQTTGNPIFTGALGVHNGVVIHESTRVPEVTTNVRRAILMGAQAGVVGYGLESTGNRMSWVEELFDFKNSLGVSAGMIWGCKKVVFNSEDFAVITMPTYAVQHG